ncbi:hypothetical protein ACWCP6_27830 [Streptomyces sp. NPDC002004]
MADEPASISIQNRYAPQFAADLEKNLAEQEELRTRLEQLRSEEAWLRSVQGTLPAEGAGPAATAQPSAGPASATAQETSAPAKEAPVPQPRQEETSSPATPAKKTGRARKSAAAKTTTATAAKTAPKKTAKRAAVQKTAAKKTEASAKKTMGTTGEPPLGTILLSILESTTGEPRTAGEVTSDLEKAFPARARDVNTVRNTLERLVAKSRIERSKQGSTVYYSVPQPQSQADAQEKRVGEESEKVPTQV